MSVIPWDEIWSHVQSTLSKPFAGRELTSVGGGCINACYVASDGAQKFFIKLNDAARADMFSAEAEGLLEIQKSAAIRVPEPICWGRAQNYSYLVLEFIALGRSSNPALLGAQLACMHAHTQNKFGWYRDNTIGATPQYNAAVPGWIEFWRERRLGPQRNFIEQRGASGRLITKLENLMDALAALLAGHVPQPSLLHGDLWSGNAGADALGQPVIFDPAVYYGDRETDIAMTELFGGFDGAFYQAYKAEYPLAAGYRTRRTLYNLYHVLNHYTLFGGGYAQQAERMTDELLSEVRS